VIEVPGIAVPTADVTEDPPSLSVLVMTRVAWGLSVSESVAVTVEASEAEAVAVLVSVPVAEERMEATTV
jgi:hypothetical protein